MRTVGLQKPCVKNLHFIQPINGGMFNEYIRSRITLYVCEILDRELMRRTGL